MTQPPKSDIRRLMHDAFPLPTSSLAESMDGRTPALDMHPHRISRVGAVGLSIAMVGCVAALTGALVASGGSHASRAPGGSALSSSKSGPVSPPPSNSSTSSSGWPAECFPPGRQTAAGFVGLDDAQAMANAQQQGFSLVIVGEDGQCVQNAAILATTQPHVAVAIDQGAVVQAEFLNH